MKSLTHFDKKPDEIPVLHRLAIIYLLLPLVIWLVGWYQWWFGAPAALLLVLGLRRVLLGSWNISLRPLTVVLLVIALAWVMATAAGGVFDVHNFDWLKHRAILLDLARGAWPTYPPTLVSGLAAHLPVEIELPRPLLRYYLGYYIVPGLVAKWFGVPSLNVIVPFWTWSGVALSMLLFTRGLGGWKAIIAATVLMFFSGMDIVRAVLSEGWKWFELSVEFDGWPQFGLGRHSLEWGSDWSSLGEYVSFMHSLMWVPQHFIAGAMYALLLIQLRHHRRFLAVSGVVVGASLFWSPFVAIGLVPLVVVLLIENGIRPFLSWQNLTLSFPLVLLLATYLTSDSLDVPQGWLWDVLPNGWWGIASVFPQLYLTEFLALAILLVVLRPRLLRDPWFGACVAALLLLPWYSFGKWNDLVVRGLIPGQILLCYYCARTILGYWPKVGQLSRYIPRFTVISIVAAILSLGAITPLFDLSRANNDHDFGVFRYGGLGSVDSILYRVELEFHSQYVAYETFAWYRGLLRERDATVGLLPQSSQLIVRSIFDVYILDGRVAAFVKSPCGQDDVDARFILQVFPNEAGGHSHDTLDFDFEEGDNYRVGDTCLTARLLPDYEIGALRFGQFKRDQTGHKWIRNYYLEEYRDRLLANAGDPIIRSNFDVYLEKRKLLYSKASCTEDDVNASFWLRITPFEVKDLPKDRWQQGFQVIGFGVSEHGGRIGEDCLAIQDLPDYRVLRISTGQSLPGGGSSWQGDYTFEE